MYKLNLGDKLPKSRRLKTKMSNEKTNLGNEKVIFLKKNQKNNTKHTWKRTDQNAAPFSQGFYHWVMFLLTIYKRVKEELKIDFESFVILQCVVSHSLYQINKTGDKTYTQLENQMENILHKRIEKNQKLTLSSISAVLNMPRETVRRKIKILEKQKILEFHDKEGIKLGELYNKVIYQKFVKKTGLELGLLIKKWKKTGALETLMEL